MQSPNAATRLLFVECAAFQEALSAAQWPKLTAKVSRVYVALSAVRETERLLQRPLTSADVAAVNSKMSELAAGTVRFSRSLMFPNVP
eukprot:1183118-Prorocentrum_minimum.AAC.2